MKYFWKRLLLLTALTALLSVPALAADTTGTGFFDISNETGVTVTPDGSGRVDVIWGQSTEGPVSALYENSEKLTVEVANADNGHYLLIVTTAAQLAEINESNIYYINQAEAQDGTVTFDNVFPKLLAADGQTQTDSIFITASANNFTTKQITLGYANNAAYVEPLYILGDTNGDKTISSADASLVLRHDATVSSLEGRFLLAGDVNKDGNVTSADASMILRYDAEIITSFD